MTDMYLLFKWTEEREGKVHVGIYTTVEKARAAAELEVSKEEGDGIRWKTHTFGYPSFDGEEWDDSPYEIEKFTVDTWTQVTTDYSMKPYKTTREVFNF